MHDCSKNGAILSHSNCYYYYYYYNDNTYDRTKKKQLYVYIIFLIIKILWYNVFMCLNDFMIVEVAINTCMIRHIIFTRLWNTLFQNPPKVFFASYRECFVVFGYDGYLK